MVGHTGVIPAAVKAVETVDACLGRVVEAVHASGGACVITADHGNCDHMLEDDGSPNTAHSLNPVPFIVTAEGAAARRRGHPRRRRADGARAARDRAAGGDDGPLAAGLGSDLMGDRENYAPGTFCWADLGTTDADAAKAFYTGVFGWEAVDQPAGEAGTYTTFKLDGATSRRCTRWARPSAGRSRRTGPPTCRSRTSTSSRRRCSSSAARCSPTRST